MAAIRSLEATAGTAIFDRDPYVKFLPLILQPPRLQWTRVRRSDPTSDRCIVIPAYGRDALAREGWFRFGVIAAFSLLHCRGIERYRLELLMGQTVAAHVEALHPSAFFDGDLGTDLRRLEALGVKCRSVSEPFCTGDVYRYQQQPQGVVLRVDADSAFLPGALSAPCFKFDKLLGHSGLNQRHTGRHALGQLFHEQDGRMRAWPRHMQVSEHVFLHKACEVVAESLTVRFEPAALAAAMAARPWPSEGLSYMKAEGIPDYLVLRQALLQADLIPAWDDEIVKLLLACSRNWSLEPARIPVLEYSEYESNTPDAAVINFRNAPRIAPIVQRLLDSPEEGCACLGYIRDFVDDLIGRAA